MSLTPDASNWTRDADGNFVDWTKPPHYVDGILNLVLPGEDYRSSGMAILISKRLVEYTMILRKQRNQARNARRREIP